MHHTFLNINQFNAGMPKVSRLHGIFPKLFLLAFLVLSFSFAFAQLSPYENCTSGCNANYQCGYDNDQSCYTNRDACVAGCDQYKTPEPSTPQPTSQETLDGQCHLVYGPDTAWNQNVLGGSGACVCATDGKTIVPSSMDEIPEVKASYFENTACYVWCPQECDVQNPSSACKCEKPAATDLCQGVQCPAYCDAPHNALGVASDFAKAYSTGSCNKDTGKCEYPEPKSCVAGCTILGPGSPGAKASEISSQCVEECDNGIDDDLDGKTDCADPLCGPSLYCSCQAVGSSSGNGNYRNLKFVLGGYDYAPSTPSYGWKERDADTLKDAQRVFTKLKSTAPFDKASLSFYVTRMPVGVLGAWRSDLLAKCGGGDYTIFVNYLANKTPNTRLYSMNADMYKTSTPDQDFAATIMHEIGHGFAGLWEEYVYADGGIANKILGTFTTGRDFGFNYPLYGSANCAVTYTEQGCKEYFSKIGVPFTCVQGCSAGAWYRSSEASLMSYVDLGSTYNAVSQKIIQDRLQELAGFVPNRNPFYTVRTTKHVTSLIGDYPEKK